MGILLYDTQSHILSTWGDYGGLGFRDPIDYKVAACMWGKEGVASNASYSLNSLKVFV